MLGVQITDPWGLVFIIISASVCITLLTYCVVPWIVSKRYPVTDWISMVSSMVKKTETILHIVGKNDVEGRYSDKLQLYNNIISITKDAVLAAEQLYKTKELEGIDRKNYALDYTKRALQTGGITISSDIEDLIKDSIESSVMAINTITKVNESKTQEHINLKK